MIQTEYIVTFITGRRVRVWAFGAAEAKILAQAEEIRNGNDYTVSEIKEVK